MRGCLMEVVSTDMSDLIAKKDLNNRNAPVSLCLFLTETGIIMRGKPKDDITKLDNKLRSAVRQPSNNELRLQDTA